MKSIFLKIFSGYILIVVALAILIVLFALNPINDFYMDNLNRDLFKVSSSLDHLVKNHIENNQITDLNDIVKDLGKKINTRITIIRSDGVVLADSENDPLQMENHNNRPEFIVAMKGQTGSSVRYSETVEKSMLYVAVPVIINNQIIGVIRSSLFTSEISRLMDDLQNKIWLITLIIVFIALLGSALFSKSFSKPIVLLTSGFKQIASGDFKARVRLEKNDEISELANNFNNMASQVEELFSKLSQREEQLNTVISSIQEGLLVLDQDGKVNLYNESLTDIFKLDDIMGKNYWEVFHQLNIQEFIQKRIKKKNNRAKEVKLGSRSILISGTFLTSRNEIIIVCSDITEMKKFDGMKKELISNVSHELRTPLTAIKGYAETLAEDLSGEQKQYLEIINKHTNRLINIVKDLLTLSEFEDDDTTLNIEEVDIQMLMERTVKLFDEKSKTKGLKVDYIVNASSSIIKADTFKLEQILINLIDNAIKYTDHGGVKVLLDHADEDLTIRVIDTGIGIKSHHQKRIFERFYVTNKSRSRKLGGTGLGLSIVKHIVLLHNGTIKVESTPGEGTTFIVKLPIVK